MSLLGGLAGDSNDRAPLVGGAFSWEITPWVGLEASGTWVEWGHQANGFSAAMRALVPLRPSRSVAPFLAADAQDRRRDRRPPPRPSRPAVVLRGHVFIGGYYDDPLFGPYPWWPRTHYPYRYFPVYDDRAEVRVLATPKSTAVYVDGFYAGIADDFVAPDTP